MSNSLNDKRVRRKELLVFLYTLFILICLTPYEFNSVYLTFLPERAHITVFLFGVMTTLAILFSNKYKSRVLHYLLPMVIMQMFGFAITDLVHGTPLNTIGTAFNVFLSVVLVMYIDNSVGLLSFIKKYNRWILLMSFMGLIAWALVTFMGLQPITTVIDRGDGRNIFNYGLTFSKTIQYGFKSIRYAGFFDEPGAMGYWGIFALLFNKVFINDRRLEWLLIVFLCFTFSMGYYAQLLVYLLLFHVKFKTAGRSFILYLALAVGIVALYSTKGTEYDEFYQRTIGRIEIAYNESETTGSILLTDNREEIAELAKRMFLENPLFGTSANVYFLDNAYETLARYGIVGSIFVLYPFLFLIFTSIKKNDSEMIKAMVVLCSSFVHRPFHDYVLYFFMLYILIVLCYQRWQKGYKNSTIRFHNAY